MKKVFIIAIVVLFVVLTGIFISLRAMAPEYNFGVLMTGNVIMAVLSVLTFFMVMRQLQGNSNAFLRGVYGSTFLKLFVCMIAILVYAIANKPNVHKPSLFILFGIYALYSGVETWLLSKQARGK